MAAQWYMDRDDIDGALCGENVNHYLTHATALEYCRKDTVTHHIILRTARCRDDYPGWIGVVGYCATCEHAHWTFLGTRRSKMAFKEGK